MKSNTSIFIKELLDGFQSNKGKASVYCFNNKIIPEIIYNIIIKLKNNNAKIFIVVDSYNTRKKILDYFSSKNININEDYNITILSKDFINIKYKYNYFITITIGINKDFSIIEHLYKNSKFTLSIITKNEMDNNFINNVRNILPNINISINENDINSDNIYFPVEEHRLSVCLSDDDREIYDKYTNYINTTISIFGDLSNIEKYRIGDNILNISSTEFCNNVAKSNGWREDLDMSIDFQKQIDTIYNPNAIYERAHNFYNITKNRKNLVCNNKCKLEKILEICNNNSNKKILIISKDGSFASTIAKYINSNSNNKCGEYHDCIEDKILLDSNNKPICYKSGDNKGKPRIVGSQFQSTAYEKQFNEGIINILSIKNCSNPKLKIAIDLIIITSPLCSKIEDIKRRYNNVIILSNPNIVYKIYCDNTIENTQLLEQYNKFTTIINENENLISYDENSGNIIL